MKFAPHTSGKSSYASFATVKEHIVEYVQKSYIKAGVDVAKSLKKMECLDLDTLAPACAKTKLKMNKGRAEEQELLKLRHQEQCARHLDRVQEYKDAMCRAFAMIKSQHCTKTMQISIAESRYWFPDYHCIPISDCDYFI